MTTKRLDSRDGQVYVLPSTDPLWLAVRIAMTTGRPLLLRGDPGTGKSSLAAKVALDEKWRYYEHTVTPRTDATDVLWTFDSARRSAKASSNDSAPFEDYEFVEPGPLWWAFDRDQARFRGQPRRRARDAYRNDQAEEPSRELNSGRLDDGAVVLIDDIDKAGPDVPNGLLGALGSGRFRVDETGTDVELTEDMNVLVVITTNNERESSAGLRTAVHRARSDSTEHRSACRHRPGPRQARRAFVDQDEEGTHSPRGREGDRTPRGGSRQEDTSPRNRRVPRRRVGVPRHGDRSRRRTVGVRAIDDAHQGPALG